MNGGALCAAALGGSVSGLAAVRCGVDGIARCHCQPRWPSNQGPLLRGRRIPLEVVHIWHCLRESGNFSMEVSVIRGEQPAPLVAPPRLNHGCGPPPCLS